MTLEELDANYKAAGWLIAKRSTVAAGKALIFTAESLDSAAGEIAAIYGLSAEEVARVHPTGANNALDNIQKATNGLFGETMGLSTGQAMTVAKEAVASEQKVKLLKTLMTAGPKAAAAAMAGGKAASQAAGKGTPWGWIATAVYAAGTGSWFAYNLRAFNLAAYELVRLRENIEVPAEPSTGAGLVSVETFDPVLSTISAGANAVSSQAEAVWDGAVAKGEQFAGATSGLLGRVAAKWRPKPKVPDE